MTDIPKEYLKHTARIVMVLNQVHLETLQAFKSPKGRLAGLYPLAGFKSILGRFICNIRVYITAVFAHRKSFYCLQ